MTVFKNYYNRKFRWTLITLSCLYLLCSTISCTTVSGEKVRHYHMKISEGGTKDFEDGPKVVLGCPNCLHESETERARRETDKLRLEAIKKQILQKLGLKHKPNVTKSLPKEVLMETIFRAEDDDIRNFSRDFDRGFSANRNRELEQQNADEFYGRMSELIVFAEEGEFLIFVLF